MRKVPTGMEGLDEVTNGGLPFGRPTLVCGGPGCGKTLMAIEFLIRGATQFGEPGIFVSFEETPEELARNVASLGFDIKQLVAENKLLVDHVRIERAEIEETGEYDLEGLFVRLGHAVESIGAKRIAMDTIESLFSGFTDLAALRAELRRLFRWLKDRQLTTIITGERGEGQLTRQGLEEYVSDCVILLDHRVSGQVSTRRMRIVKYRGSTHGTNEYPFLIDEHGLAVLPITSAALQHGTSEERISTGIERLDAMLGGGGLYRGTSTLISGTAGTGKTSLAATFADATCRRGERCLYFAFEESQAQIIRNMRSIGVDLDPWIKSGKLRFLAARPTSLGLEAHLVLVHKAMTSFDPSVAIFDPISALMAAGGRDEATAMLLRLVDFLKARAITAYFTDLTGGGDKIDTSGVGVSSLMDTWILLRVLESAGERNRGLYILKSRGTNHSNQIREFLLTSEGVRLVDAYLAPTGVLTGTARMAQEAEEQAREQARQAETARRQRTLDRKRHALEAQIAALTAELESEEADVARLHAEEELRQRQAVGMRQAIARSRRADEVTGPERANPSSPQPKRSKRRPPRAESQA